jgi:hypothetical protein
MSHRCPPRNNVTKPIRSGSQIWRKRIYDGLEWMLAQSTELVNGGCAGGLVHVVHGGQAKPWPSSRRSKAKNRTAPCGRGSVWSQRQPGCKFVETSVLPALKKAHSHQAL